MEQSLNNKKSIRVCHVTSAHPVDDIRIFQKECVSLAKNGYETYLVQPGESYDKSGVHLIGTGEKPEGRLKRMLFAVKKAYKSAIELDCEIYQLHDPELLRYALKLKRKGKKVIFDSHEKYDLQIKNKYYLHCFAPVIAWIYAKYERYILKRIDGVIFPCLIDGLNPFEGKCKNIALVGNQPILEELYTEEERKPLADVKVCYVGGVRYDRGISQAVEACNKLDVPLLLAGRVLPESYKEEFMALDKKKIVKYYGQLDRQQVREVLYQASIGLVTELNIGQNNKVDTLPTKAYEYMATGIPVIISESAYNNKVVDEYKFGLHVDPANSDQVAEAIKYLIDNPEEARIMGKNGKEAVKKCFNWNVEEKKLFELYEKILEN